MPHRRKPDEQKSVTEKTEDQQPIPGGMVRQVYLALYRGESKEAIAHKYGLSLKQVRKVGNGELEPKATEDLRRKFPIRPKRAAYSQRLPDRVVRDVFHLACLGIPKEDIGQIFGIPASTVGRIMRRETYEDVTRDLDPRGIDMAPVLKQKVIQHISTYCPNWGERFLRTNMNKDLPETDNRTTPPLPQIRDLSEVVTEACHMASLLELKGEDRINFVNNVTLKYTGVSLDLEPKPETVSGSAE